MNPIMQILSKEFETRKSKNKNYSLRAFARLLELDPSSLSKILKGQRIPSLKAATKISQKLALLPEDFQLIQEWLEKNKSEGELIAIDLEKFRNEIDCYHLIMLEAFKLPVYANSVENLRYDMKIDGKLFYGILRDLEEMKFIAYEPVLDKVQVLQSQNIVLRNLPASEKNRALEKGMLQLALQAVDSVPCESRDHATVTLAIPASKVPYFRDMIIQVWKRINLEAEREVKKADTVYNFTFTVYPAIKQG